MRAWVVIINLIALVSLGAMPVSAQSVKIVTESYHVPAKDPGIQLHVRNKRPEGVTNFDADRIVLFVHGATFPSETGFDIALGGPPEKNRLQLFREVQLFPEEPR